MNRFGLHCGWLAGVVFVVALLAIGALTSGYSHAHHPVGFLGMAGAPLAGWWNVSGFLVPGMLVVVFALSLLQPLQRAQARMAARIGIWLLAIAGLAFAGNGVFGFDPSDPGGMGSKLHVAMLTLALLGFLPAALAMALGLRCCHGWRVLVLAGPVIVLATLASVMQRVLDAVPVLATNPGYAQRVTLVLFFAWLGLAAMVALRASRLPTAGHLQHG